MTVGTKSMAPYFFSTFMQASAQSGRSVPALVLEMLKLRGALGRLGYAEYFDFRLYMDDLSFDEKRRFVGWRMQGALEEILIDDYARFQSLDKITMYTLLRGYELPIPELRAVYLSHRPCALPQLASEQALVTYFQETASTPVYLKPSLGSYGRGNTLVLGYSDGHLTLGDQSRIEINTFCRSLGDRNGLGWVLQEPLVPHPCIADLCGSKISGVRVHTFLSDQGASVTKAIWKINVGKEDSDNFQHGASGNMLAALDLETGEVTRVVSGVGLEQVVNPRHPVTQTQFTGFKLPWWKEVKALVCDAQLAFPGFICPGWDIAICEDGLRILEVNFFGDTDLSQHAYRSGFLDRSFMELLRSRALDELLTGPAGAQRRSPKNQRVGLRKHHWPW